MDGPSLAQLGRLSNYLPRWAQGTKGNAFEDNSWIGFMFRCRLLRSRDMNLACINASGPNHEAAGSFPILPGSEPVLPVAG